MCHVSECRIYVDIMTGEKLSSIELANMEIIYGSVVHPVGGEGRGIVILARCKFQFIREHKNLV